MVKLNLGCGHNILPKEEGWVNVDFKNPNADIQANVIKLPFDDDYADHISAHHIIEHFDQKDVVKAIKEWKRVLKPGGRLDLEFPDIRRLAKVLLECPDQPYALDRHNSIISLIMGDHSIKGAGHFWAWCQNTMIHFLLQHDFTIDNAGTPPPQERFPGGAEVGFCKIYATNIKKTKKVAKTANKRPKTGNKSTKRKVKDAPKTGKVSRNKAKKAVKKVVNKKTTTEEKK